MKKFLEILERSKKNKEVISVRMNDDEDDEFSLGIVLEYTDTVFALNSISRYGHWDGIIIAEIENIDSFDRGDEYTLAYQHLISVSKSENRLVKFKLTQSKNWQFDLLKSVKDKNVFLSIGIKKGFLMFGKLLSFDKEQVSITPITRIGKGDGESTYKISDITDIHFNRLEDLKRQTLFEWNKKK